MDTLFQSLVLVKLHILKNRFTRILASKPMSFAECIWYHLIFQSICWFDFSNFHVFSYSKKNRVILLGLLGQSGRKKLAGLTDLLGGEARETERGFAQWPAEVWRRSLRDSPVWNAADFWVPCDFFLEAMLMAIILGSCWCYNIFGIYRWIRCNLM